MKTLAAPTLLDPFRIGLNREVLELDSGAEDRLRMGVGGGG